MSAGARTTAVEEQLMTQLSAFPLLSGLEPDDLDAILSRFEERMADEGECILRQGAPSSGLALVIDGQVAVRVNGKEVSRFARGDVFGEISPLLGIPVTADVIALGPTRYLQLAADKVQPFLIEHPRLCFRLLQAEARRLRDPRRWYSTAPATVVERGWDRKSWRSRKATQQPAYPDQASLDAAVAELGEQPPLIFEAEARSLTERLAEVAAGKAFFLQAGDCAESFKELSSEAITSRVRVILQMAVILAYGSGVPVVKVGRMAGQFAKPRSNSTERVGELELPVFRGHIINDDEPLPERRIPNPQRMVEAYNNSAIRLNLLRGLIASGFARLDRVHAWNLEFASSSPQGRRYFTIASDISRALRFIDTAGFDISKDRLNNAEFWTSHEALLLPYEEALTRQDPITGDWYDCSAHMLWIGERTRLIDGAHVEFLSGVRNPIGCKLGPSARPSDVVELCERLNPEREPGRLTLIARMGARKVTDALPPLLAAARESGHAVVWACDPMHGNTTTTALGRKTRHFDDIMDEIQGFFAACAAEASWPGGIHVELTGEDVTECLGGSHNLSGDDLEIRYTTTCDPRLNANQSLDLAFRVAELMTA